MGALPVIGVPDCVMFFIAFLKQGVQLQQYPSLCYHITTVSCTNYIFSYFIGVHFPIHRPLVNGNIANLKV